MNNIKAILVDFDGTLANTQPANYSAYAQALAECGIQIDFKTFMHYSDGKHWSEFLPPIFEQFSPDKSVEPSEIAKRKTQVYPDYSYLISFNEPLIALLKSLSLNYKMAIVTTASKANVLSALKNRPDILALFPLMITGEEVKNHKPHPEAYELAAERLSVTANECIIFEDSVAGIQSAEAFGGNTIKIFL